jgi:intermediate cleaving peptidase 55
MDELKGSIYFIFSFREGELVLVDGGGEYNGYASDITRTWPVSGKFSESQKELYQAVLNVNKACIKVRVVYPPLSVYTWYIYHLVVP